MLFSQVQLTIDAEIIKDSIHWAKCSWFQPTGHGNTFILPWLKVFVIKERQLYSQKCSWYTLEFGSHFIM